MNSNIYHGEIDKAREKEKGLPFSDLLSKIPRNVSLETDDGSKRISIVPEIVDFIHQVEGFHIAKSTKVLCVKRLRMVPMLDNLVQL